MENATMNFSFKDLAMATVLGAGSLTLMAGAASAAIACNGAGDCWHTQESYTYPDSAGIVVHEDNWRWDRAQAASDRADDHARMAHYRWREHEGRGYWHDNTWVTF
jgi:hypothetical protein